MCITASRLNINQFCFVTYTAHDQCKLSITRKNMCSFFLGGGRVRKVAKIVMSVSVRPQETIRLAMAEIFRGISQYRFLLKYTKKMPVFVKIGPKISCTLHDDLSVLHHAEFFPEFKKVSDRSFENNQNPRSV